MATTFSVHDLRKTLGDLAALAATPEGRRMLVAGLERSIQRSKMGADMLGKVRLMYDFFRDPAEPVKPKLMIGAALLYLVMPADLIPDWFALVGFADDFAAIAFVWKQTQDVLKHYEQRRAQRLEQAIIER